VGKASWLASFALSLAVAVLQWRFETIPEAVFYAGIVLCAAMFLAAVVIALNSSEFRGVLSRSAVYTPGRPLSEYSAYVLQLVLLIGLGAGMIVFLVLQREDVILGPFDTEIAIGPIVVETAPAEVSVGEPITVTISLRDVLGRLPPDGTPVRLVASSSTIAPELEVHRTWGGTAVAYVIPEEAGFITIVATYLPPEIDEQPQPWWSSIAIVRVIEPE
jgi:hypothetical protein